MLQPADLGIGQLFWLVRDAIVVVNLETERIVLWNSAAEALFGYSAAEAIGLEVAALIPERLRDRADLARFRTVGSAEWVDSGRPFELTARRRTGEEVRVEVTLHRDKLAEPFLLGIIRDISDRRQAEARRDAQLRIARLASQVDAEQLMTALLDEMVGVVGGDAGGVYLWDEQQGGLVTVRNSLPTSLPLIRPGEGGAGRVWLSQEPLIIHDYQAEAEPTILREVKQVGVTAGVLVPLKHQGRRLGVLGISSFSPEKRFTQADVEVLELLASTAAATLVGLERSFELEQTIRQLREAVERAQAEICERERAERALRESEERFRLLAENARDVIFRFRVHPTRGFEYVSPAAEKLTGYTLKELYQGPAPAQAYKLVHPEDQPILDEIIRTQVVPDGFLSIRWIHKSGEVIWTEQHHSPIFDAEGRLIAVEAVVRDVTERRRSEEARLQLLREQAARAEAEAAVRMRDEFLSAAAHDLKTPVTSLRGTAQLLLRHLEKSGSIEPARLRQGLATMERQTGKLTRLIGQLLDVSRIEAGKLTLAPEEVDLVPLLEGLIQTVQVTAPNHAIALYAPPELIARVDPIRLEQVLTNLLDNAIKYSPEGGPIDVTLEQPEARRLRISVLDRGLGIAPEHRDRIFERFHRAHAGSHLEGLGLGLYISRQIVELHGGTIVADFPAEGGTCFSVTLPAPEQPAGPDDCPPVRPGGP
ncbi:MAG TPA: PAS domain S-box protein [Dehalococcoidia bacterium]|nr:PAS domain S-box protein [Dehalococcoidia bacterium]